MTRLFSIFARNKKTALPAHRLDELDRQLKHFHAHMQHLEHRIALLENRLEALRRTRQ